MATVKPGRSGRTGAVFMEKKSETVTAKKRQKRRDRVIFVAMVRKNAGKKRTCEDNDDDNNDDVDDNDDDYDDDDDDEDNAKTNKKSER